MGGSPRIPVPVCWLTYRWAIGEMPLICRSSFNQALIPLDSGLLPEEALEPVELGAE